MGWFGCGNRRKDRQRLPLHQFDGQKVLVNHAVDGLANGDVIDQPQSGWWAAKFSIRAPTAKRRDELIQRVITCAKAGADAIGCQLKYHISPGYKEIIPNPILAKLFSANLSALGRFVVAPDPDERMGSTDMGDLSHLIPCLHPYLETVPISVAGHTQGFADLCLSEPARKATLDAAKALALTALDLLADPDYLIQSRSTLNDFLSQN